jgi:hypothetical protein
MSQVGQGATGIQHTLVNRWDGDRFDKLSSGYEKATSSKASFCPQVVASSLVEGGAAATTNRLLKNAIPLGIEV